MRTSKLSSSLSNLQRARLGLALVAAVAAAACGGTVAVDPIGASGSPADEKTPSDTGGAVKHFLRNGVGAPAFFVFIMQFMPMWKNLKAIGATLAHDTAITVPMQQSKPLPAGKWSRVTQPVLSVGGGKSPAWMRNAQKAIAEALSNGRHDELIGGDHMAKAELITPMVKAYFAGS